MNTPLLEIRQLSIAFKQGDQQRQVVNRVSLSLSAGETLALVGESGSGKSLTALSVLRLLPAPGVIYPEGDILFLGQSLLHAGERHLRQLRGNDIAMIFQEPMSSLNPLHTLEKQLAEVLILHGDKRPAAARRQSIIESLERVGIRQPGARLKDFPHQLSGGERQRVMIAMALLMRPKLLIADEPTTALDVTVQAQILQLLDQLRRELGMAMLFITHDLNIVRRLADRVAVMQNGHCVETNQTQALFTHPQHDYTRRLLASAPRGEPMPLAPDSPVLLELKRLRVDFALRRGWLRRGPAHKSVVRDISFTLRRGECLGLVGESGSGKSTTALALLRLLKSSGEIWFDGLALHRYRRRELLPVRRRVQVIFQDPHSALNPRLTMTQIVAEGLLVQGHLTAQQRDEKVKRVLVDVGLDPESRHRYPAEFSGGQRQRIAIARALILEPELLILDEPTSSLDYSVQSQILSLLKSLSRKHGLTYLFISHDLSVVRTMCHRVMVLREGEIVEYGDCGQVFDHPSEPYTRQLLQSAVLR
ncbi:microcin C ABC transporter ATP-binding protein YejF [Biostraticola tofi]|uniref:Microcin C transport system ATP-binding protein n=1 Tax=Biostraticola tofi TaxID=466109 RepID=A0A4R3Z872_9GAMM|nr:microcin C ABC transporter ATP-binding protein YejF [Biostraticola tofi]TCW00260.1 microcin C transport system ATP-binding protein [Biostraticola tofi]